MLPDRSIAILPIQRESLFVRGARDYVVAIKHRFDFKPSTDAHMVGRDEQRAARHRADRAVTGM